MRLAIQEDMAPQDPSQRWMNLYGGQKSHHSFNCPIFTIMNINVQDDTDDATVVDEKWSKDESQIIDGIVKPILASLKTSTSQKEVDPLIVASM